MKHFFEATSNLRRYMTFPTKKQLFQIVKYVRKYSVECLLPNVIMFSLNNEMIV